MNIVLPIVLFATCLGLFARRITPAHWAAMAAWIGLIIAWQFFKH